MVHSLEDRSVITYELVFGRPMTIRIPPLILDSSLLHADMAKHRKGRMYYTQSYHQQFKVTFPHLFLNIV